MMRTGYRGAPAGTRLPIPTLVVIVKGSDPGAAPLA